MRKKTLSSNSNNNNKVKAIVRGVSLRNNQNNNTSIGDRDYDYDNDNDIAVNDAIMNGMERRVYEYWDVKSGCRMHTKGGRLIPTVAGRVLRRKKTRLVIEIWGPPSSNNNSSSDQQQQQQQQQQQHYHRLGVEQHCTNPLARQYRDGDTVIIRLLRHRSSSSSTNHHPQSDDNHIITTNHQTATPAATTTTTGKTSTRSILPSFGRSSFHNNSFMNNNSNKGGEQDEEDSSDDDHHDEEDDPIQHRHRRQHIDEDFIGDNSSNNRRGSGGGDPKKSEHYWIERHRYTIDTIENMTLNHGSTAIFTAKMGFGQMTAVRDFVFSDRKQAQSFFEALTQFKEVLETRTFARIVNAKHYNSGSTPGPTVRDENEPLNLLVEIVSAKNLPIADIKSTDPYVTVWQGRKKIHSTKYIANDLNPIWTLHSGSLFVFSTTFGEFFSTTFGLTFLVMDFDATNQNDQVAQAQLTHEELLNAHGERKEYPLRVLLPGYALKDNRSHSSSSRPKLALRIRKAHKSDFEFMEQLNEIKRLKKKRGMYADTAFVAPNAKRVNRMKRESKKDPYGTVLHRMKPGPDPSRPPELTEWMTDYQIEDEAHRASKNWIEAGSGDLGRIYIEIIGCDKLPNLDSGMGGDLTDCFCTIVYEDAIVNTDVINDCLSPRWLPWTQRAFVLNIGHPSSQIFIGVFDHDSTAVHSAHDIIGRVAIDITSFTPNTEYNLAYNIYKSNLYEKRKSQGKLKVRLRLELHEGNNTREFLVASTKAPPINYINVAKKADFRATHFVCHGEEDLHRVNIPVFKSNLYELEFTMEMAAYYVLEGCRNIFLWRGHYPVELFWCIRFDLPVHSIVAFLSGIILVENYNLLPSYFFFCIAWFFLAMNGERKRHPSKWNGRLSYCEIWWGLLFGQLSPQKVDDNEKTPLISEYEAQQRVMSSKIAKAIKARLAKKPKKSEDDEMSDESDEEQDNIIVSQLKNTYMTDISSKTTNTISGYNPLKKTLLPIQTIVDNTTKLVRIIGSVIFWDETYCAFIITNVCLLLAFLCYWAPWGAVFRWSIRITVWTLLGPWMKLVDWFFVMKLEEGSILANNCVSFLKAKWTAFYRPLSFLRYPFGITIERENALKLKSMKKYMFGKYTVGVPRFKAERFQDTPLPESYCFPSASERYHCNIIKTVHGQRLIGDMIPKWADSPSHASGIGSTQGSYRKRNRGAEVNRSSVPTR